MTIAFPQVDIANVHIQKTFFYILLVPRLNNLVDDDIVYSLKLKGFYYWVHCKGIHIDGVIFCKLIRLGFVDFVH